MEGEKLPVGIEQDNANNARAVAIQKCGFVVGHVPKYQQRLMTSGSGSHMLMRQYTPIYSVLLIM